MNIKEQYYKYGASLGIKVNDLQRLKMLSDKFQNDTLDNQTVTRFEVIDENGIVYVAKDCKVELSYQDDGKTLKVFINN